MLDINSLIVDLGRKARKASRSLATASSQQKRDALIFAAENIKESTPTILEKNQIDCFYLDMNGLNNRYRLNAEYVGLGFKLSQP